MGRMESQRNPSEVTMNRKCQFAAILVILGICLCLGPARAQDMVFTTNETGQAAAPPPPAQGPPSEALANALRLYQQEKYAQASVQFQRIVDGETGDQPANVQKAQFFLGKCLYHLKFYQAALGVFEQIVNMTTGHLYFQATLQWLAQLARELPEPADIIGLVGKYGDSISVLQEFNTSETKDLYNELLFLMGRYWYRQGEFAKARDFFLEVNKDSDLFVQAVFFAGVTHVRERRAEPAAKAFKSIVDKFEDMLFLNSEEERFLNLAWLSLARIYYSTKHWDSAVEAWNKIPQSSEYYLDALMEESWAYFQVEQLDRALGNVHTLNSPFFDTSFYPESIVLKAVIYFNMCMYEDAQITIDKFSKEYQPIQDELTQLMKKYQDNLAFFEFLKLVRQEKVDVKPRILRIIKTALGDRTLLRNIEYVDHLDEEMDRLKKMPPAFINSGVGARIQQDIAAARSVAVDNTGNLAKSRYERLLEELRDYLNQATRIQIEILNAIRGQLTAEIANEQTLNAKKTAEQEVESDAEHVLWPFEGEFWRDELGYYRQPISSKCGR